MRIDIASSDDLAALYVAYIELVDRDCEDTLELVLAPGTYGVASIGPIQLDLAGNPPPKQPKIDIVVRGAPGVVFRDLGILVQARSLTIEDVILTGRHQGLLDARVAERFCMRRCVVAANSWDPSWGGALLRVGGLPDQPAFSVELDACWFVRNDEQSQAALLAITPATGAFVERVALRGVHFLGNATHSDLVVHEARELIASELFVVKHGSGVFLRFDRCERVAIDHSTFILGGAHALAAEDTRTWCSGLELAGSTIYAAGAVRKLPGRVRGAPELLDGAELAARAGQLDDVVAALLAGSSGDAAAHLRAAVGL